MHRCEGWCKREWGGHHEWVWISGGGSGGGSEGGSGGGAGITLEDPDGNNFLVCIDEGTGGTVELYKAGNKKLETTTTGVTIT